METSKVQCIRLKCKLKFHKVCQQTFRQVTDLDYRRQFYCYSSYLHAYEHMHELPLETVVMYT